MTARFRARTRAPWIALPLAALMTVGAAPAFAEDAPAPAPVEEPADASEPTPAAAASPQLAVAAPEVADPQLTVTPSTLDPAVATTLTVSGTGYVGPGAANGVYVNVGVSTLWQPGQVPGSSGWVVSGWVPAARVTDGAFTTTLVIPAGVLQAGGSYGVATFAAHALSVTNRTLDAWKPVTVQAPAPIANPQLTVTPGTLNPAVENTITVVGTGYVGPAATGGVYVNLGAASLWQPGQVPSGSGWVKSEWVRAAGLIDGRFSATLVIPANTLTAGTAYGIATFATGRLSQTDRSFDAWKPVTVEASAPVANPQLTVTPSTLDPAVENVVTVSGTGYVGPGAANGVYVNLGAAALWQPGQIPGSSGWVRSGWVPASLVRNGAFTTTLTVPAGALQAGTSYGVATFAAHGLSITNRTLDAWKPVTVTGGTGNPGTPGTPGTPEDPGTPGTAAPRLTVSPSTIDPAVATVVTIRGTGYAGAGAANGVYVSIGSSSTWQPGQVPSQGGWIASGWVQPGALSGGSFTTQLTIPAGALRSGGSYGVATFAAHALALTDRSLDAWRAIATGSAGSSGSTVVTTRTAAAEAPADEGAEVESSTVTQGGAITATAGGFEPNETGILVVVYSDPVVLDNAATADADGVVTWTGRLPQDLTGSHTLTFQGSQDVGVAIEIAERESLGCTVADARLEWGFKETFRAYISGTIANGEWTTSGNAGYETPSFSWTGGAGDRDAATGTVVVGFDGAVQFTGHEGALDTTIANPRIEVGTESALLILDVAGTTQDGREIVRGGVEFAELDLADVDPVAADGTIVLADIPAELTAAGAEVFGTYAAGEALDPLTLLLPEGDCASVAPDGEEPVAAGVEPVASGFPVWIAWGAAALLLALIALVAVVLTVRRRRA